MRNISFFTWSFVAVLICACYLISIIIVHPLVGIKLTPVSDGVCKVVELYPNGWAKYKNIRINDLVYCQKDKNDPVFKLEKVDEVVVYDGEKKYSKGISYYGMPFSFIFFSFIHILYFCISFIIAIILYLKNKGNKQYRIISLIIVLISLGYLSGGVSAREDTFGVFITILCMWLTPIVLIEYLNTMIPSDKKFKSTKFTYILLILLAIISLFFLQEVRVIFTFLLLIFVLIVFFVKKYKYI
ncbi:hypothetical protein, partial [Bacillus sp. JJ722]|uniref:hypothetical protein n=1 Tax=Bacillus sp. JJ722 TaxID=3122973 RepID=UPI002FFFA4A6